MDLLDLHWLAGFLEGEGSFCKAPPSSPHSPFITVQSTDRDVIGRVASLFGTRSYKARRRGPSHWKEVYGVQLRGRRAVALMTELRPLMGDRRKAAIDLAVASQRGVRPSMTTESISAMVNEYRAGGVSMRRLAEKYGVSQNAVWYHVHQGPVGESGVPVTLSR